MRTIHELKMQFRSGKYFQWSDSYAPVGCLFSAIHFDCARKLYRFKSNEINHVSMINEISHVSSSERHGFESRRSLNSYRVLFYSQRLCSTVFMLLAKPTLTSSIARLNCCCCWACCNLEPLSADLLTSSLQLSFNLSNKSLISLEP